ncbi:MAG: damage-inducible protein CinA [Bacteroidetes bacterium]|nr:MAG: damage-inducible protein CinA [Bacteroidota bacterium]
MEKFIVRKIVDELGKVLIKRTETIAVAESVTAGDLQVALSHADKALDFFQGGITAYNLGQKAKHLAVDPIHAISCNSVSQKIADKMAKGAALLFCCDWAIGITGYASPVPEQGIEILFACFSIVYKNEIQVSETIQSENDQPNDVRQFYTGYILNEALKLISAA